MIYLATTLNPEEEKLLLLLQLALNAVGLSDVRPQAVEDDAFEVAGLRVAATVIPRYKIGGSMDLPGWYIYEMRHDGGDRDTPPDWFDHEVATVESAAMAAKTIVLRLVQDKIEGTLNRLLFPSGEDEQEYDGLTPDDEPYPAQEMTEADFVASDFAADVARERRLFRRV